MQRTRAAVPFPTEWRSCFLPVFSLLLLACTFVQARSLDASKSLLQYAHRTWGLEEGLLQPTIYSLLQTRDGFLWLGTQDSLIRFDGVRFREFEYKNYAPLHGALVRSLLEDRAGNVWAGTIGSGLFLITPDGGMRRFDAPSKLPTNNVFCLDAGRDGSIWACTDHGLLRGTATTDFASASSVPARGTCETPAGIRWVAGLNEGLATINSAGALAPVAGVQGTVTALMCARDGTVWAGNASGVMHFRGDRRETITTDDGLPDNVVNCFMESDDGSLWIATDDGITRWRQGSISVYRAKDGLSHSVVLSLMVDREGTLWAGTKDGLDQFTNPKLTPYTTAEGLSSNEVGPVLEDKSGHLWVGTLDAGLNFFDSGKIRHIGTSEGLPSERVLSLAVGNAGEVWAGTGRGLVQLRNGRVASVELRGEDVRSLFVDREGTLWIGTERNLYRRDSRSTEPAGSASRGDLILAGLHGNPLFVQADGSKLAKEQQAAISAYAATGVTRPISCTYVDDARGSVWIGTLGAGLVRWRDGTATLARVHVKDGLYDNRIYGILADGHSHLWIASSKGIFRIAEQELEDFADGKVRTVTSIPFTTGQLRFECRGGVQPAASRSADGRLWFATTNGVAVVNPDRLQANDVAPPVQITALMINGERHAPTANVRLLPGQRNLEIRYTGLSFVSPEKVTFRYILDGYDTAWTDAGPRREAFFTNLPPRTFHFRVMARNADGVWSREAASLAFEVEPRVYQRWWFYPLLAGFIAALVFAAYRRRIQRIQQGYELVLAERSRIARELHDTLLQGLSGVTMQLHALWMRMPHSRDKQMLEEIIQDAAHCSTEARQSLWNLRSPGASPQRLSDKVTALSHEMVGHTAITLELKVQPVYLPEQPESEFQMLRILREALSNVVRHSQASTVMVALSADTEAIEMRITDDGHGFDAHASYDQGGHFGLVGMRERASEIGATLDVQSAAGHGTTVLVRLPAGASQSEIAKPLRSPLHQLQ